jgi:hypothetical protein
MSGHVTEATQGGDDAMSGHATEATGGGDDAMSGHATEATGGEPPGGEDAISTHASGATGGEAAADAVRGLAVAADGLRLELRQTELPRARETELAFAIVGADGERVRDFQVEHAKRMHLIVVRRDGEGFQHLHPELGADGVWRTGLTLAQAGAYRVFADFKRGDEARTLAADLAVDGAADYAPLPAPAAAADTGDGYRVRLDTDRVRAGREAELRFTVSRDGETVHTEPYLGAGGHLVALREGDLAYLHVHPGGHGDDEAGHAEPAAHDDAVAFVSEFPSEGRYRLYLQFKHDGRVHTAGFTRAVAR